MQFDSYPLFYASRADIVLVFLLGKSELVGEARVPDLG